jgi:hypothetical protein
MGIKIIKEKKVADYTFIDDSLNLDNLPQTKESDSKKERTKDDFRLRGNAKLNRLRHKSKLTGGHNMQGHSAVYE